MRLSPYFAQISFCTWPTLLAMNDTKNILASKTVWGALLMLASLVLARFGIDLDPDSQASLVATIGSALDEVMGLVGVVMAIWGRMTATKGVTVLPAAPLALLLSVTLLGGVGCSGVPADLVARHLATAGGDHQRRIEADVSLLPVERVVWAEHYAAMDDAVAAAKGGAK